MSGQPFERIDLRDLAAVEKHAREVLRQCEFLRRNGATDVIRWSLIATVAWNGWRVAAKADRRHATRNDWYRFVWRLPQGYGRPS